MTKKSSVTLKSGYDVIVVGSGIVGAYVARRIAEGKHQVLLLDKRSKEELGAWKNTGHNLDKNVFDNLPISKPTEAEIGASVDSAEYRTPGKSFRFKLPMHNVKLGPYTVRMVDDAVRAGVKYQDRAKCVGAYIRKGKVEGVTAVYKDEEITFQAGIVIDVSGIDAVIRNSLPEEFGIDRGITPKDYLNVYSEDHEVDPQHWPAPFTYHSELQGWSGSRRKNVIGIGAGRFAFTGEDPVKAAQEIVGRVIKFPSEVTFQTRARVPVRHALHKLVGPGVMILGDAAFQGKPLNGEGISVMLYAAEIASQTAINALDAHDVSEDALWPYCVRYHRDWGKRFAPFHRLRYELLRFSKSEQAFMLGLGLYGPDDMSSIMLDGTLDMTRERIVNTISSGWRAIAKPDIVIRLVRASMQGEKLKKLYAEYPSNPRQIKQWISQADALLQHE